MKIPRKNDPGGAPRRIFSFSALAFYVSTMSIYIKRRINMKSTHNPLRASFKLSPFTPSPKLPDPKQLEQLIRTLIYATFITLAITHI